MKVTVYGAGYVGLVTAVCLAEIGHDVTCVEIDQKKLALLQQGTPTIYEEGLEARLKKNLTNQKIAFSQPTPEAVAHGEIQIIAVGTPPNESGTPNTSYIESVSEFIGKHLQHPCIIVNKSTAPIGTTATIKKIIEKNLTSNVTFSVVSNPEFLREGKAIEDCLNPERIIIGTDCDHTFTKMRTLYEPLIKNSPEKILCVKPASAELIKYAANAFLAMKISFINEMAEIAETFSADITEIKQGIGTDSRIGMKFLNAGCGFGGSCFPKDVLALQQTGQQHHIPLPLIDATLERNNRQKHMLFKKILQHYNGNIEGKKFAVWGLAFKPNTDDVREASSIALISSLLAHRATVQAYDPIATTNFIKQLNKEQQHHFIPCDSADAATVGADALVIVTEWEEFLNPDIAQLIKNLNEPVIFDGRNIIKNPKNNPLQYYGIGINAGKENETV